MHRLSSLRIFCDNLDKVEIKAPMLRYFLIKTIVYNKSPTISWKLSNLVPKVFVVVYAYEHDSNIFTPNDDMLENWRLFFWYFNNARKLKLLAPYYICKFHLLFFFFFYSLSCNFYSDSNSSAWSQLNWLERERSLSPLCCVKDLWLLSSYHKSPPVMHLLKSLIFLAPRATTLSITNVTTLDHKNTA